MQIRLLRTAQVEARNRSEGGEPSSQWCSCSVRQELVKALDEIARLRADLNQQKEQHDMAIAEIKAQLTLKSNQPPAEAKIETPKCTKQGRRRPSLDRRTAQLDHHSEEDTSRRRPSSCTPSRGKGVVHEYSPPQKSPNSSSKRRKSKDILLDSLKTDMQWYKMYHSLNRVLVGPFHLKAALDLMIISWSTVYLLAVYQMGKSVKFFF